VISRFFIDRPIFAAVLSIVITLAGGLCVFSLPLAQFPKISPPVVSVTCTYPGASAYDVSEAVAAPIEQQVNGVENMMFMSSSCTNDGSYSLSVTFRPGHPVSARCHQANRRDGPQAFPGSLVRLRPGIARRPL
jgi:multidrug efflux pump